MTCCTIENLPRPEYPRPQFVREEWVNLNGTWTCEFDPGKSGLERGLQQSKGFSTPITVPFCPESKLSGLAHTDFIESMFYHRKITVPAAWSGRKILIHFGGVDYECELFIDGKSVGTHFGGTVSFEFDITKFVEAGREQDLVLYVKDELRSKCQPVGKQCSRFQSFGCSYTRTTGIWQTVWLEPVSAYGLKSCKITPDLDRKLLIFEPAFFGTAGGCKWRIRVLAEEKEAGCWEGLANTGIPLEVPLSVVRAWSPEDPFLYDIEYTVMDADGK